MVSGFFYIFAAALVSFSTVVADPIVYNFTLRCDVESVKDWCAQVYVWEIDSHTRDDPLEYSWVCTSEKAIQFLMITEPGTDELFSNIFGDFYHFDYIIYTTCTQKSGEIRSPQDKCKCYPSESTTFVDDPELDERVTFTYDIHLKEETGLQLDDQNCEFPRAFMGLEDWTINAEWDHPNVIETMVKPCGWSLEKEENATHHFQWIRTPRSTFWMKTFLFLPAT